MTWNSRTPFDRSRIMSKTLLQLAFINDVGKQAAKNNPLSQKTKGKIINHKSLEIRHKENAMKKLIINKVAFNILFAVTVFAASVASASAQNSKTIKVNIPFDYSVENKTLPAGKYILCRVNRSTISIQSEDGKISILAPVIYSIPSIKNTNAVKVVFNRYGDNYFLSQVWTESGQGEKLLESKPEREAKKGMKLAKNRTKKEVVEIAALIE